MWGPDYKSPSTWLPQVGTTATCDPRGFPHYDAVYQLYHPGYWSGGTNNESFGLILEPGDKVSATVTRDADGPDGSLHFRVEITITRPTTGETVTRSQNLSTAENCKPNIGICLPAYNEDGVQEKDAAWEGGCILESEVGSNSGALAKTAPQPTLQLARSTTRR